jgi:hypothetical protein
LPIDLMSWRNQRGPGREKNSALHFVRSRFAECSSRLG